jgi:hypothetical protein
MSETKEKTNTKTLEIKNVTQALNSADDSSAPKKSLSDVTDPTLAANRSAIAKDEATRKVLLSEVLKKSKAETDNNDGIEFSAATAVLKMTPDMLNELANDKKIEKGESTVKLSMAGLSDEMAKKIKIEVKTHYIKKARILEQEIVNVLAALKTNNPAIIKQFDKIKLLLAKHSGRIKDK